MKIFVMLTIDRMFCFARIADGAVNHSASFYAHFNN